MIWYNNSFPGDNENYLGRLSVEVGFFCSPVKSVNALSCAGDYVIYFRRISFKKSVTVI